MSLDPTVLGCALTQEDVAQEEEAAASFAEAGRGPERGVVLEEVMHSSLYLYDYVLQMCAS